MDSSLLSYLKKLKQFGVENDIPNVTETVGRFLNMMVKIKKPQRILEIGCANGYSTLWMAEAAREVGAKITAIDWSKPTFESAVSNLAEAGFGSMVDFQFGNAIEVVSQLNQTFDFVFVDGQKRDYWDFWVAVEPRLADHAVVVFDDVLAFPEKTALFHKNIQGVSGYERVVLPVDEGDGIMLLYKE
ncbi:hypothetical protein COY07_05270 [Candidatus Peregrinibacteria bacterium CG_4_10_14_0_2_um_filter_43_11]|nr:MAG: hypothetical protein COY07_05270 [Candidatus Peregrinibacteria bacterium CG_4_10_14_0_2_um_filter_43_11]